jgi:hypothetical protein
MLGDLAERYEQDQSKAWYWKQTATVLIVGIRRIPMKRAAIWGLALVSMFLVGYWVGRTPSKHIERVAKVEIVPDASRVIEAPVQATAEPKPSKQKGVVKMFVVSPEEQTHMDGVVVGLRRQEVVPQRAQQVKEAIDFLQGELQKLTEVNDRENTPDSNRMVEELRSKLRGAQESLDRNPKP